MLQGVTGRQKQNGSEHISGHRQHESGQKFTQTILSNGLTLRHTSESSLGIANNRIERKQIIVSQSIGKIDRNKFVKTTEIVVGDKVFHIKQAYQLLLEEAFQNDVAIKENKVQPERDSNSGHEEESQEYQMWNQNKNSVKNILKAFGTWAATSSQIQVENKEALKQIMSSERFNNATVINVIRNEKICPIFDTYLKNEAKEWLRNSRIKDRKVHRETIKKLIKATQTKNTDDFKVNKRSKKQIA